MNTADSDALLRLILTFPEKGSQVFWVEMEDEPLVLRSSRNTGATIVRALLGDSPIGGDGVKGWDGGAPLSGRDPMAGKYPGTPFHFCPVDVWRTPNYVNYPGTIFFSGPAPFAFKDSAEVRGRLVKILGRMYEVVGVERWAIRDIEAGYPIALIARPL